MQAPYQNFVEFVQTQVADQGDRVMPNVNQVIYTFDTLCMANVMILPQAVPQSKKISNDQELIQSDPLSCPQNQNRNN